MTSDAKTNVSIRVSVDILERIDANAIREGLTRTDYVLSWLPETAGGNAETHQQQHVSNARQS